MLFYSSLNKMVQLFTGLKKEMKPQEIKLMFQITGLSWKKQVCLQQLKRSSSCQSSGFYTSISKSCCIVYYYTLVSISLLFEVLVTVVKRSKGEVGLGACFGVKIG